MATYSWCTEVGSDWFVVHWTHTHTHTHRRHCKHDNEVGWCSVCQDSRHVFWLVYGFRLPQGVDLEWFSLAIISSKVSCDWFCLYRMEKWCSYSTRLGQKSEKSIFCPHLFSLPNWTTIKHFVPCRCSLCLNSSFWQWHYFQLSHIDLEAPQPNPLMSVVVNRCGSVTIDISKIKINAKHTEHTACSLSFHYVNKVAIICVFWWLLFLSSFCKTVIVWRKQNIQGHLYSYDSMQVRWAIMYLTCTSEVQSVRLLSC